VTSCGSGVSACFNSLAMRVAGLPDPILYPGSYSDWSRAGLPVALGPEPGAVPETLTHATSRSRRDR
jgi:thiosulfate/3-mercaptopyruvate sulfurtransferase